jgi:hypothetical protein
MASVESVADAAGTRGPCWAAVLDDTDTTSVTPAARQRRLGLVEESADTTDYRLPVAVLKEGRYKDVTRGPLAS